MAPHSSTFAWKIPWMEEPGGLQSMGSLEADTTERLPFHFSLSCIGEGNGNPLQCSCLENPRDRRARWAAVYGVAQSQTWLKQLSSSSRSSNRWYAVVKNLYANAEGTGDSGSIPSWGRSLGVGNGNILQYSCLKNPMDREDWSQRVGYNWVTEHTHAQNIYRHIQNIPWPNNGKYILLKLTQNLLQDKSNVRPQNKS